MKSNFVSFIGDACDVQSVGLRVFENHKWLGQQSFLGKSPKKTKDFKNSAACQNVDVFSTQGTIQTKHCSERRPHSAHGFRSGNDVLNRLPRLLPIYHQQVPRGDARQGQGSGIERIVKMKPPPSEHMDPNQSVHSGSFLFNRLSW